MNVYWLEQLEADVPVENDWLSPSEVEFLRTRRFAKRRADWRLGRWTAKRAVASCLGLRAGPPVLAKIEIRPAPSGVPEVFVANKPADLAISLSHCNGRAVCVVTPSGVGLGCDLEVVEPRSNAFLSDYFTAEEQSTVAQARSDDRNQLVTLLWSAKESALKALNAGLRLDTRSVIVSFGDTSSDPSGWNPLQVRSTDGRTFHGWWQVTDSTVRTLVADSTPAPPIPLRIPDYRPDTASLRAVECVRGVTTLP